MKVPVVWVLLSASATALLPLVLCRRYPIDPIGSHPDWPPEGYPIDPVHPDWPPQRYWGDWSLWSSCSTTCGQGFQQRHRYCLSSRDIPVHPSQQEDCTDSDIQSQSCCLRPCSACSVWSSWSRCQNNHVTRKRACLESSTCPESNLQTKSCPQCRVSVLNRYTSSCGFWGWGRCTRYRTVHRMQNCGG